MAARPVRSGTQDDVRLSVRYDVESSTEAIRGARTSLRQALLEWSVDVTTANAALDVAHELMANAVQHAQPPVTLTASCDARSVVVEVTDGSVEPVRRLPYRPGVSERGLGVRLVTLLSTEWGQRSDESGKQVWARVARRHPRA
jgi:two-component sensor histidine kinase